MDAAKTFRMGMKVEGMHSRLGKWTPATVLGVNEREGTLELRYGPGDEEKGGTLSICPPCNVPSTRLSVPFYVLLTLIFLVHSSVLFPINSLSPLSFLPHSTC